MQHQRLMLSIWLRTLLNLGALNQHKIYTKTTQCWQLCHRYLSGETKIYLGNFWICLSIIFFFSEEEEILSLGKRIIF